MPLGAAVGIRSLGMGLGADKVRQHLLVTPATATLGGPLIVVAGVTTDIDHAIDRRRAAQGAPARRADPPPVEAGFGLGQIAPVITTAADDDAHRRRHIDGPAAVGGPG